MLALFFLLLHIYCHCSCSFVSNFCAAGFKYLDLRKMDQWRLEFLLLFIWFNYLPANTW